jgi:DNA-binding transcriptional ArsR family regulator
MDVYSAVSNPTRRRILDLLRGRPRPAGELVDAFPSLPQPAVSRHLRVLREAGLVGVSSRAQQRIYSLRAARLRELDAWVSTYRVYWTSQLDALETHLDRTARGPGRNRPGRP